MAGVEPTGFYRCLGTHLKPIVPKPLGVDMTDSFKAEEELKT